MKAMCFQRSKVKIILGLICSLILCNVPVFHSYHAPVAKAANKPKLTVAYKNVALKNAQMKKNGEADYVYSAVVKNSAKTGTVKKIQYYYQIQILKKYLLQDLDL